MVYSAARIFTGDAWLHDAAIEVEGGKITAIYETGLVPGGATHFEGGWILPAFIDLQVYGAGGRLFSLFPEAATLHLMESVFAQSGTLLFQPTVATNTLDVVHRCMAALRQYRLEGGRAAVGLHLEGPWLNPQKRGAHLSEYIHAPQMEEVEALLAEGGDVISMITLAPETCSPAVVQRLRAAGIILSAGHSAADYETALRAFDGGIDAVTHLYNAMSPLQHRAPGLVGAAMDHEGVYASIIPDGHHVDAAAIRIARKAMGQRLFAITDAVTDTADGPYRHQREGSKYVCNGTLSGSAISMLEAARNLVRFGVAPGEAVRMCSTTPARVLKRDHAYGCIAPGYAAKLLVVSPQFDCLAVISGQEG